MAGEQPPADLADPGPAWQEIAGRLAAIETLSADYHRRAASRETVIDHLRAENEELRSGLRRVVLDPVVTDLIRLHDSLTLESARLGAEDQAAGNQAAGALLRSFSEDVELLLDRCGLEAFTAEPGETFIPGRHAAMSARPTSDERLHNVVAEVIGLGFRDQEDGRVRRPVRAHFHRYAVPASGLDEGAPGGTTTDEGGVA